MQYYTANVYNKIVKYTGTFRNKTNIYVWVFYADTGENVVICKTKSLAFFLSLGHFMLCIKIAVEDFILEKYVYAYIRHAKTILRITKWKLQANRAK